MRLIHCADIHLDSRMNSNLTKEQSKIRRAEILNTFLKMVEFSRKAGADAILIAGDLFDTSNISAACRNAVVGVIEDNPQMGFYYLRGNHDNDNFLSSMNEIPQNLFLFDNEWRTYKDGNVAISGIETGRGSAAANSLTLDMEDFNIVMLHGQEDDSSSYGRTKDGADIINLRDFQNMGIDYMALGHIHQYKLAKLDGRGFYCYPGCLEGRGYDECGQHGFVVIDIEEETGRYKHRFVPFASRTIYELKVDVSDCETTFDMSKQIMWAVEEAGCSIESMVKIILIGEVDVESEKSLSVLQSMLGDRFFSVKIEDNTRIKIDFQKYLMDESLKGEFVRQVMNSPEISAEDKGPVIRYGLLAIAGEEVQ